ncbi:MAG: DUF1467 family protein [Alphaproteobacteria bacterium]
MNWFVGTALFVIVWFLMFFMVLPWGAQPPEQPEAGHASSAPANPRMGLKLLVTTAIAIVIWLAVDWVIASGFIDFYRTT